jgi:hypothetical protein
MPDAAFDIERRQRPAAAQAKRLGRRGRRRAVLLDSKPGIEQQRHHVLELAVGLHGTHFDAANELVREIEGGLHLPVFP